MQSRRDFLKSGGALMVSFSTASLTVSSLMAQGQFDTHPSHIDPKKLDSWLAVGADGTIKGRRAMMANTMRKRALLTWRPLPPDLRDLPRSCHPRLSNQNQNQRDGG